jgi:hypothetical protein
VLTSGRRPSWLGRRGLLGRLLISTCGKAKACDSPHSDRPWRYLTGNHFPRFSIENLRPSPSFQSPSYEAVANSVSPISRNIFENLNGGNRNIALASKTVTIRRPSTPKSRLLLQADITSPAPSTKSAVDKLYKKMRSSKLGLFSQKNNSFILSPPNVGYFY